MMSGRLSCGLLRILRRFARQDGTRWMTHVLFQPLPPRDHGQLQGASPQAFPAAQMRRWAAGWRMPIGSHLISMLSETVSKTDREGVFRLPEVSEKEIMMGFPLHYTALCKPKGERKTQAYWDCRHTLLGNSWSVPVVSWLLGQLLSCLGLIRPHSPQDIVDKLNPEGYDTVQARLWRP